MPITPEQLQEVEESRKHTATTRRATVQGVEDLLYTPLPVLDHGFVRVIDYMGDDSAIVQAARVSYGKGTKQVNQDKGLIFYLMRHWHTTPFEMCEIKFHVKLPMFVARQWIRHRTANVNEYSARYSILDKEFYIPQPQHLSPQSTQNHQGRNESNVLSLEESARVLEILKDDAARCYQHYEEMMNTDAEGNILNPDRQGLARELARMNLPVNAYTQWYWKVDLHNLLHFCRLRADAHAQYEIRAYAEAILKVVQAWVPLAHDAFVEYRQNGVNLSATGLGVVKRLIAGENVTQENSGLTKREWSELSAMLGQEEGVVKAA